MLTFPTLCVTGKLDWANTYAIHWIFGVNKAVDVHHPISQFVLFIISIYTLIIKPQN